MVFHMAKIYVNDNAVSNRYNNVRNWEEIDFSIPDQYVGQIVTLKFRWHCDDNAFVMESRQPGFCIDDVNITGTLIDPVFNATSSSSDSKIDLTWTPNEENDTVMIVSSFNTISVSPTVGKIYNIGEEIADGITVIYKGTAIEYEHSPLKYGTNYYYEAWSTRNASYSDGQTASATTAEKESSRIALIETWGDSDDDTGVTWYGYANGSNEQDESDYWLINGDAQYYGNNGHSAYVTYDDWTRDWRGRWSFENQGADYNANNNSSVSRTLSCELDLTNFSSDDACNLIFDWLCNGYSAVDGSSNDAYGRVYIEDESGQKEYFGGISGNNAPNRYFGVTEWQSEIFDLSQFYGQNVTLGFEWNNSGAPNTNDNPPSFCVDNIKITNASSSVILKDVVENISSVSNSSEDAVNALNVTFTDQSTNAQNSTIIKQFVVSQGEGNAIGLSDWRKAIAGAELRDGNTVVATGDVYSHNITFTPESELLIADGNSKNYELFIWLKENLYDQGIIEGDEFDFAIETDDIITGLGDDFIQGQTVSSGGIPIRVEATGIAFITEPSSTAVYGENLLIVPEVAAVDKNGNVDIDINGEAVNLSILDNSNNVSVGLSSADVIMSSGIATFSDLLFLGSESTVVTLKAEYDNLSLESDEILLYESVVNNTFSTFYIDRVQFKDIDNSIQGTGLSTNGFGLYSNQSAVVERGETYNISLSVRNAFYKIQTIDLGFFSFDIPVYEQPGYAYVWIDWDHSGTFESDEQTYIGSYDSEEENYGSRSEESFSDIDVAVPLDAKYGSTMMRVVFTTLDLAGQDYASATEEDDVAEAEDYTIVVASDTWTGEISTDWNNGGNWELGRIPYSDADVTIPSKPSGGNFPVVSGSVEINNLEIEKGATLTFNAGSVVTINGDLTTNDGLSVNNTAENPASLIVNGEIDGETEITWLSLDNSRFWYMGHPVVGRLISDYNHSLNFEDDVKGYRIYVFDNENYTWKDVKSASYQFSEMEAIALKVSSEQDLSYSGVLNNEPYYSFNAMAEGYQTIANPYPCYIDLESMYQNGEFEGFSPTVYTYASDKGIVTYDTYNAATGEFINNASQYISPCQSFWIHTDGDYRTNVITVSKDDCKHINGGSLKSTSTTNKKIRLRLMNTNTNDETLISFSDYGQMTFSNYDSEKRMVSGKSGNIYTIKDSKYVAINSLPESSDIEVIPLGYRVSQSGMKEFTIQVNDLRGFESDVNIYLVDKSYKDVMIDLREQPSYTFTPTKSEDNDRFEIRFVSSVTTDINDIPSATDNDVSIYAVKQVATVKVSEEVLRDTDSIIYVYNLSGQLVKTVDLNKSETTINLPQANCIYIIKVDVDGVSYQNKVVSQN